MYNLAPNTAYAIKKSTCIIEPGLVWKGNQCRHGNFEAMLHENME